MKSRPPAYKNRLLYKSPDGSDQQERKESFYNPIFWKDSEKKVHNRAKEIKEQEWRKRFRGQQANIVQLIVNDQFEHAVLLASLCWSSLPDSPYGQQSSSYTPQMVKALYDKYLKEESVEATPNLHLKKGFLKEFMDPCCKISEPEKSGTTPTCKEDYSQCFNYSDVWERPEICTNNGGKNNNRFGYGSARGHQGIDIVSGPTYKEVHTIMCGTVIKCVTRFKTNEYKSHSLGNTLMIKSKSKEGKTVYLLYCHLDKIYVKENQKVRHGEVVALSGSTGNASYSGLPNGLKGHGIAKEFWHVHIEASTRGEGYYTFMI